MNDQAASGQPAPNLMPAPSLNRKLITLACLMVVALALGGLAVGFGHPTPGGWQPEYRPRAQGPDDVLPAVPYLEMDGKARGPNRAWTGRLSTLVSTMAVGADLLPVDTQRKAEVLARRAARRTATNATPALAHPVDAKDTTSCYQCHGEGKVIDMLVAPKIRHPRFPICIACHRSPP